MVTIKVLTGSIRPQRFNMQPAKWIYSIAKQRSDINTELIDLEKIDLPFLDEAIPPSQHQYSKEHTKKWSKIIREADGFVFVTPEYNHSFSPVLKNALDYLFHEWNYKPVCFVSYGSLAGGARAVEQLRTVVGELKMYDLREQILLPNYWENLDEKGNYQFNTRHVKSAEEMLDTLIFWTEQFKDARSELIRREEAKTARTYSVH